MPGFEPRPECVSKFNRQIRHLLSYHGEYSLTCFTLRLLASSPIHTCLACPTIATNRTAIPQVAVQTEVSRQRKWLFSLGLIWSADVATSSESFSTSSRSPDFNVISCIDLFSTTILALFYTLIATISLGLLSSFVKDNNAKILWQASKAVCHCIWKKSLL